MVGSVIGSYKLLKELGRGGMGAVYLGEHTLIGRAAAVKFLLPQYSRDAEIVNRFFNEARAATQIRHPGIVEIFDFGYDNGAAYIVMEFLEGESLTLKLAREGGRLDLPFLIEVTRQVASTLRATHDKGIVHRDLKPDNVFVVPDPDMPMSTRIKLLDFGIAKLSGEVDPHLKTRTGAMMGTPTYMSPEQCRGAGGVDHRTDVYALGCLMFEMATGRPPYVGQGPGDVMGAHIYSPVPRAIELAPTLLPAIDELIVRMLAKEPQARVQSMHEVLDVFERLGFGRNSGRIPSSLAPIPPAATQLMEVVQGRPTTLQGAAAEVSSPSLEPERRRSGWLMPVAAVAAVVLGAGGWYINHLRVTKVEPSKVEALKVEAAKVEAAKVEAPKVEPSKVEAPKVEAATTPAPVHFTIDSMPSGADVFSAAGTLLGRTPLAQDAPRSDGNAVYSIRLHGFRDAQVTVPLDHSVDENITLERHSDAPKAKAATTPAAAAKSAPKTPTKSKKPVNNGFLNPFDNR